VLFKPEIMHIHPIETFIKDEYMKDELKKDLLAIRRNSGDPEIRKPPEVHAVPERVKELEQIIVKDISSNRP